MSLHPLPIPVVPELTAKIARAALPAKNLCLTWRDELGTIFTDESLNSLFPTRGQPAAAPWRLALVTLLQFVENLSDRQATQAVCTRLDWKYLLSLELDDPGFDSSVLCEFRARLLQHRQEKLLFEILLQQLSERGLLKTHGKQRTDSTHVLGAVRALGRLECVGETLRHCLEVLATVAPGWLVEFAPAEWYERYTKRFEDFRLPGLKAERVALAEVIGQDGLRLLQTIYGLKHTEWEWLGHLEAVEILRQVWVQQYYGYDEKLDQGVKWRVAEDTPPSAVLICTPYDYQARYSEKHSTKWTGYKVHLTETCEEDTPNLIVDVQTTTGPVSDFVMLEPIHQALAERAVLPAEHLVDAGYVSAQQLVQSRQVYAIDLIGQLAEDNSWQYKAGKGFAIANFDIDWDKQEAVCPEGKHSVKWLERSDRHEHPIIGISFARADCAICPLRPNCTHSATHPRQLAIRTRADHEALLAARQRQTSAEFANIYKKRAGIEGTISQGVREFELRRSRYIGLAKTNLQHWLTATALNLVRTVYWLQERGRAKTRQSAFARLSPARIQAVEMAA